MKEKIITKMKFKPINTLNKERVIEMVNNSEKCSMVEIGKYENGEEYWIIKIDRI